MKLAVVIPAMSALLLFALGGLAYVRLAPSDPDHWHADPRQATPGMGRYVVKPQGGDRAVAPVDLPPGDLLARIDRIALDTPRTRRLAGAPEAGRITYVTRSRLIGFPDYTTVAAWTTPEGTALAIFARLRFGQGDMGVNRRRVEGWLAALDRSSG